MRHIFGAPGGMCSMLLPIRQSWHFFSAIWHQGCAEIALASFELPLLASLLSLSLRTRLLQEGGWIHCGDAMQHMLDSAVLQQQPEEQQKRAYVNCPGFSFGVRVVSWGPQKAGGPLLAHGQLRVMPFIYRVLPIKEQEEPGRGVYCLPRLVSPATLERQQQQPPQDSPLRSKEEFKLFW